MRYLMPSKFLSLSIALKGGEILGCYTQPRYLLNYCAGYFFTIILVFCNSCSCIIIVFHWAAKDQSLSKLAAEDHFGLLVVLHFSLLPSFHKFRVSKFTIFKFTIFASKLWSSSTSYRPRIPNSSCLSVHPSQKPSSGNISGTKPIDQMGKWANGD